MEITLSQTITFLILIVGITVLLGHVLTNGIANICNFMDTLKGLEKVDRTPTKKAIRDYLIIVAFVLATIVYLIYTFFQIALKI